MFRIESQELLTLFSFPYSPLW